VDLRGFVSTVDEDGDICIFFPSLDNEVCWQCLAKDKFDLLSVLVPFCGEGSEVDMSAKALTI